MQGGGLDDDMADGDLGDGTDVRRAPSSNRMMSHGAAGQTGSLPPRTELFRQGSRLSDASWVPGRDHGFNQAAEGGLSASWRLAGTGSLLDLSKEELTERLQEATKVAELLHCELEVAHRYLEGKYEALKILQGKCDICKEHSLYYSSSFYSSAHSQAEAILDKATGHTKNLLQKSEERAKALEKEVNSLQWELTFSQVQMKKFEQFWEQKYSRISSENKTLTASLEERRREVQQLRAENGVLSQQCLELLSMLSVREQRACQATSPLCGPDREDAEVELAVLGACQCPGVAEACPCSQSAAASRKQLLQLRQELDAQQRRREEALMVADAFRIAFEQQLRKRSEHFLLRANMLKSHQHKAEGSYKRSLISVGQRLRELLPSSFEVKMPDDPTEVLYRLLDLRVEQLCHLDEYKRMKLNDKEEALAHQRKVSIMLAHSAEELQKQLQQPQNPSESNTQQQQSVHTAEIKIQQQQPAHVADSEIQPQELPDPSVPNNQTQQSPDTSESKTQLQKPPDASEPKVQLQQPTDPSESQIKPQNPSVPNNQTQQPPDASEPKVQLQQPTDPSVSQIEPQGPSVPNNQTQQSLDTSEPKVQLQQPTDPSESQIQPQDPSVPKIQAQKSQDPSMPKIKVKQPQDPSEPKLCVQQSLDPSQSMIQSQQPTHPAETNIQSQQPTHPAETNIQSQQPTHPAEPKIQPQELPDPLVPNNQTQESPDPSESKTQLQQPPDSSEPKVKLQQPSDPSDPKIQMH